MSFVEQFLVQTFHASLSHQVLESIQNSCCAVQDLLTNCQLHRNTDKLQFLCSKMERVQHFLQLKQEIVGFLEGNSENMLEWLSKLLHEKPVIVALIERDFVSMKTIFYAVIKNSFLKGRRMEDLVLENDHATSFLRKMQKIKESIEQDLKVPLTALQEIDQLLAQVEKEIQQFQISVQKFNFQMLKFVGKLVGFEEKISQEFKAIVQGIQTSEEDKQNIQSEHQQQPQQLIEPQVAIQKPTRDFQMEQKQRLRQKQQEIIYSETPRKYINDTSLYRKEYQARKTMEIPRMPGYGHNPQIRFGHSFNHERPSVMAKTYQQETPVHGSRRNDSDYWVRRG